MFILFLKAKWQKEKGNNKPKLMKYLSEMRGNSEGMEVISIHAKYKKMAIVMGCRPCLRIPDHVTNT